jgi:signal peptide peptidase SppA
MRRHPVILGICILLFIGVIFFTLIYVLSLFKGDGGSLRLQAKVGVVRIEGIIADSRESIEQIDELADDDGIKAVVVRIDSPGGGVAASQEIYRAVRKLQIRKKVIVSMGSVAASGGYLIATAADKIVANPGTITGSISAVMHFADVQELMKKVGVRSSVIKSGKFKDIGSPVREMTAEEKQLIQGLVDDIYDGCRRQKNPPGNHHGSCRRPDLFRKAGPPVEVGGRTWGASRCRSSCRSFSGYRGETRCRLLCKEKIQLMEVSHREHSNCRLGRNTEKHRGIQRSAVSLPIADTL